MSGRRLPVRYDTNARQNLRSIRRFGDLYWGRDKSRDYLGRLREVISAIQSYPEIGRARNELSEGLRSFPAEQHLILYRVLPEALQIVAIISANADVTSAFESPQSSGTLP